MKKITILFWLSLTGGMLMSQDTDLLLNHDLYHYMDRIDIRGYTEEVVHTQIKPYGRNYYSRVLRNAYISDMTYWEKKWHGLNSIIIDDTVAKTGKGVLKYFFRNGRDLFHSQGKKFRLYVNPALYLGAGVDQHEYAATGQENQLISFNSRGLVVRGSFFDKLGFYTEVYDNVNRFPQFVMNRYFEVPALPGEAFVKGFGSNNNGLDYFHSRAYLTFSPLNNIRVKFGHDRAFWGDGFQSLLLSDYAANHLMLQINTRIWKLEYTNHFGQMIDFIPGKPDEEGTFPRKYAVFHMLSYKPRPRILN